MGLNKSPIEKYKEILLENQCKEISIRATHAMVEKLHSHITCNASSARFISFIRNASFEYQLRDINGESHSSIHIFDIQFE